jgi:signal transduction histidine kinase/ActR/RegA family two-component response regulator
VRPIPKGKSRPLVAKRPSLSKTKRAPSAVFETEIKRRERLVTLREVAATRREAAVSTNENEATARLKLEARSVINLREANESLVVAAVNAQTLTDAAENAGRLKEEFLAMLAHELRNPLSPILNATAILQRISHAHPQLAWVHDVIKRQAEHMRRLLDDLLDVARVTGGKISLRKHPLAVADFVAQAVESSRPIMDSRNQKFMLDAPDQAIYVEGDLARLTQVLTNLINNASKYTDFDGAISLSIRVRGKQVELKIKDNGSGIPARVLPHIFDLFIQSDRTLVRAQGGLGIGLTVVRRLVEMHGGTVSAHSAGEDRGSEFTVTLPRIEAPADPAVEHHSRKSAAPRRYRIAVIEDNVDSNESIRMLLQMMGHDVSSAFDGLSGVELVKTTAPQVVLCDIGLPGLDGYGVVSRLRAEMQRPLPCMIALTGYGQPEDRANALAAGFDIHTVKPVDPEMLFQKIALYFEPALERRLPITRH